MYVVRCGAILEKWVPYSQRYLVLRGSVEKPQRPPISGFILLVILPGRRWNARRRNSCLLTFETFIGSQEAVTSSCRKRNVTGQDGTVCSPAVHALWCRKSEYPSQSGSNDHQALTSRLFSVYADDVSPAKQLLSAAPVRVTVRPTGMSCACCVRVCKVLWRRSHGPSAYMYY